MVSKKGENKIQQKLNKYLRVLKLAKKPGKEEYLQVAKISAIGIVLIGTIGFVMYLGMGVLPQNLASMNKGKIEANFVTELNNSMSSQELILQLNNTDQESETGALHLEFNPILCNSNQSSMELESIPGGGSRTVTIEVTNIEQNSNLGVSIWGENLGRYDSSSNTLEVYAISTQT